MCVFFACILPETKIDPIPFQALTNKIIFIHSFMSKKNSPTLHQDNNPNNLNG